MKGIEVYVDVPSDLASHTRDEHFLCIIAVRDALGGSTDQELDGIGLALGGKGVENPGEYVCVGTFRFAAVGKEEYGKLLAEELQNFWLV